MPQPHWKAAVRTPKAARRAQHVGHRRLQRHQQRAEGDHQHEEAEQEHDADHQQQACGDLRGEVDVRRRGAADVRLDAASPAVASGSTSSRSSRQVGRLADGRRRRRRCAVERRRRRVLLICGGVSGATPSRAPQGVLQR